MAEARLIALYSPAPQQGKSEAAKILLDKGFVVVKFADTLKMMTGQFLLKAGVAKADLWAYVEGSKKEVQIPGLPKGITGRRLQRTLGVEWGRKAVHGDIWVLLAMLQAEAHLKAGRSVVIDDLRFPNEYAAVLRAGGEAWRVVRNKRQAFKSDGHSEALLEREFFDMRLANDGTLGDLKRGISSVLEIGPIIGQRRL